MVRAAAVGVPTWIVLLGLLPFTGMGVGACLALATALAIGAVIGAERLRARGPRQRGARGAGPRRPMSPLAAAGITLAAVAVLVYVIFVIRAA